MAMVVYGTKDTGKVKMQKSKPESDYTASILLHFWVLTFYF